MNQIHSNATTDLSIIYSNLDKIDLNKENIVLLKTGSLNPVHRSHVSNMVKTKEYLENIYNFNVIGGYLSPSHDLYVESKLDDEYIPSNHRIAMCQKAIEEENQQHWLAVDKAEAMAPCFVNLVDVTVNLQNFLNEKIPMNKPIRVLYVAGLDLYNRCRGMTGLLRAPTAGIAVVYRYGENKSYIQSLIKENPAKLYFISVDNDDDQNQTNDISSTLIRARLQKNEDCEHLTYKSVLEYLKMTPIK